MFFLAFLRKNLFVGLIDPRTLCRLFVLLFSLIPVLQAAAEIECAEASAAAAAERWEQAIDALKECEEISSESDDYALFLSRQRSRIRWLIALSRWQDALEINSVLQDRHPDDRDHALMEVRLLAWSGRHDEAKRAIEPWLSEARQKAEGPGLELVSLYVNLALWQEDPVAIGDRLDLALELFPENSTWLWQRALLLQRFGDNHGALVDYRSLCEASDKAIVQVEDDAGTAAFQEIQKEACERASILSRDGLFCPEAVSARVQGSLREEKLALIECIEDDGRVVALWNELAVVLARKGRFEDSLKWAQRALDVHPDHLPFIVSHVRALAGVGRVSEARQLAERLGSESEDNPELKRLVSDVHRWDGQYAEAIVGYVELLTRFPDETDLRRALGMTYLEAGNRRSALAHIRIVCEHNPRDHVACTLVRELSQPEKKGFVFIQPSWTYVDVLPDWKELRFVALRSVSERLALGGQLHIRNRTFTPTSDGLTDVLVDGLAVWNRTDSGSINFGVSFGYKPEFSPSFQVWVEPDFQLENWLGLQLRFWHIQFAEGSAIVVNPGTTISFSPFWLSLRYYLAFDQDRGLGNSVLGSLGAHLGRRLAAHIGAGVGDRADYMQLIDSGADRHFLFKGGVWLQLDPFHRIRIDYIFRDEREPHPAGMDRVLQWHQFLAGYEVRF